MGFSFYFNSSEASDANINKFLKYYILSLYFNFYRSFVLPLANSYPCVVYFQFVHNKSLIFSCYRYKRRCSSQKLTGIQNYTNIQKQSNQYKIILKLYKSKNRICLLFPSYLFICCLYWEVSPITQLKTLAKIPGLCFSIYFTVEKGFWSYYYQKFCFNKLCDCKRSSANTHFILLLHNTLDVG